MTVTCGNINCKYRSGAGFCNKDFVALNPFGCCVHWWDKVNPTPRPGMWDYAEAPVNEAKAEPQEAEEQASPQEINKENDDISKSDLTAENAEKVDENPILKGENGDE